MMMLFNLNAVSDFHLEDPEVLFRSWDLEVWSLKAEDCLFQPLQDKENKHNPHVPTIHLDPNCSCFHFDSFFF